MHDDHSENGLIAANERFYRTFEALDYDALAALWEDSARVFCVHPGWPPLWGTQAVLDSWKRIIGNTREIHFTLTGVRAHVEGTIGTVTVFETITNSAQQERSTSGAISTNLFSYDAGRGMWLLFHHHAAHAAVPDEEEGGGLLV